MRGWGVTPKPRIRPPNGRMAQEYNSGTTAAALKDNRRRGSAAHAHPPAESTLIAESRLETAVSTKLGGVKAPAMHPGEPSKGRR